MRVTVPLVPLTGCSGTGYVKTQNIVNLKTVSSLLMFLLFFFFLKVSRPWPLDRNVYVYLMFVCVCMYVDTHFFLKPNTVLKYCIDIECVVVGMTQADDTYICHQLRVAMPGIHFKKMENRPCLQGTYILMGMQLVHISIFKVCIYGRYIYLYLSFYIFKVYNRRADSGLTGKGLLQKVGC